jgi:hypothetical protein
MVDMPDMTGWTPVTSAAGDVLGWMAPADVETPWERTWRLRVAASRAGAIDQAAGLLMDEAFDPEETWDACEASGMPAGAIDSAGNVAVTLWKIEHGRD